MILYLYREFKLMIAHYLLDEIENKHYLYENVIRKIN